MKILFDYQILVRQRFGGISRTHCELALKFNDMPGVRCDFPVLFSRNYYFRDKFNVHNYRYPAKLQKVICIINRCYTMLKDKKERYDIVHATWYDEYLLRMNTKGRLVITVNDMIFELFPQYFRKKDIDIRKKVFLRADLIIAISYNTKQDLLKIYPEIDEERVKVVYLSASVSQKVEEYAPLPESYILFVGARRDYKNYKSFFEAVRPILEQDAHVHVVCVGGGEFEEKEKEFMGSIFYEEGRVQRIDLTDSELNYVYQNAMCFVYPSCYEGFGIPILEAFANDCPCITSNTSSCPEIGGSAAIYFDPYNVEDMTLKISSVLSDGALRSKMIEEGRKRYKDFSWDKASREIYSEYVKLLQRK